MEITESVYAKNRKEWRAWLKKHHANKKEIWLIYYKKDSGKPRISYNDAVEEALCFGWIDSTAKTVNKESYAQRFSPRNPKSFWSEPNKERVRMMIKQGLMTSAGLSKTTYHKEPHKEPKNIKVSKDILAELKKDKDIWTHYQTFPERYKRIRIGWIEIVRDTPATFKTRLNYFLKMTKKGKRYGMMEK